MAWNFLNIGKANSEIARLENELAKLTGTIDPAAEQARQVTGRTRSGPWKYISISKANTRIDELGRQIEAAMRGQNLVGAEPTAGLSKAKPQPVVSANQPSASVYKQATTISASRLAGATLHRVAGLFPALDTAKCNDEAELFDAVEREAHLARLTVPGIRDEATLAVLYGPSATPESAQARALHSLRQTTIDQICATSRAASQTPATAPAAPAPSRPAFSLTQTTAPAQAAAPYELSNEALALLVDSLLGRGHAAAMLSKSLDISPLARDLVKRAGQVSGSVWQCAIVTKELNKHIEAAQRRADSPKARDEERQVLLGMLYHLGVQHPGLDYAGVVPNEQRMERSAKLTAAAQRKTNSFFATLTGSQQVADPMDRDSVELARSIVSATHGGKKYSVGMAVNLNQAAPQKFSFLPKH